MVDTKQQEQGTIRALLDERRGLEARGGLDDRIAAVDAELRRLGHVAETPQKRATRRATQAEKPEEPEEDPAA